MKRHKHFWTANPHWALFEVKVLFISDRSYISERLKIYKWSFISRNDELCKGHKSAEMAWVLQALFYVGWIEMESWSRCLLSSSTNERKRSKQRTGGRRELGWRRANARLRADLVSLRVILNSVFEVLWTSERRRFMRLEDVDWAWVWLQLDLQVPSHSTTWFLFF